MLNSPVVDTFLELVRIDSPSGQEAVLGQAIQNKLSELGISSSIDAFGNLFAKVEGRGQPVLLSAHLDTVEPGRGVKPTVEGGMIKSDGTTILGADNKAALAAILTAISQADRSKLRPLEIVFSVREETDGWISKFDFSNLTAKTGLIADRASAVGSVVLSSPWIMNLNIAVVGKPAHSSLPELAVNALTVAAKAISATKWGRIDSVTTANLGIVSGGSGMNTIPGRVDLVGEIRSFSETKLNAVQAKIKSVFSQVCSKYGAELIFDNSLYCQGYSYKKSDPAVKQIVSVLQSLNITPFYEVVFGASDANTFAANNFKVVTIGDGCTDPHTVNESISEASLEKLTQVFLAYITNSG